MDSSRADAVLIAIVFLFFLQGWDYVGVKKCFTTLVDLGF